MKTPKWNNLEPWRYRRDRDDRVKRALVCVTTPLVTQRNAIRTAITTITITSITITTIIITTIIVTSRRQKGLGLYRHSSVTRPIPHEILPGLLLSPPIRLPPLLSKNAVRVLMMMKLDVLVKFRKQGSNRCRLWSCLRRTSVLMVPWLWVGVKGHLNIQPMPHKPDIGYHLHHHNHRYQHHHHPQLISSSPHFHNTRHPRCKISQSSPCSFLWR